MTTGVAGIREKIFHLKKRMETAQKVSVIQSYFLLAPYLTQFTKKQWNETKDIYVCWQV